MAQRTKGRDPREAKFAIEYVKDFNGAAACRRAGYSPNGANVMAVRLLARPNVQAAVEEAKASAAAAAKVTVNRILDELSSIAFNEDTADGTRVKALELLAKYEGMFI